MGKKKNNHISVKFRAIVLSIIAILLCAAPCGATDVLEGETLDVGYGQDVLQIEDGYLFVYGTLNLYPGADVGWIYAFSGSTVNIYGGDLGVNGFVLVFSGDTDPVVTVYGTDFAVNGDLCEPSATQFDLAGDVGIILTGIYGNGDFIDLLFYGYIPVYLAAPATEVIPEVIIDIKPGDDHNCINLDSKGLVPVAVLTTDDFDAATVDPATVEFAGAEPVCWKLKDVDDDGYDDMIFHFRTQDLNLDQESTEATLTGQTTQGVLIEGSDEVQIVSSCKKCLIKKFSGHIHRPVWWKCRRPVIPPVKGCKRNAYKR